MKCPQCKSPDIRVIDSRAGKDAQSIRRRRECNVCGARFTTSEEIIRDGVVVVKRDGTIEDFEPKKILESLRTALHKRPVEGERISILMSDLLRSLDREFDSEIPSRAIAERAMAALKSVDAIAYIRYASSYVPFAEQSELKV